MSPLLNPLDPLFVRRRTKRRLTVIKTGDAAIPFLQREETSELTNTGDYETTVSDHLINIGGELVPSYQAVAQCTVCGGLATARSARFCFFCGRIICRTCASLWPVEGENRPTCPECYRSEKWHLFWSRVRSLIASCFVSRTPE